MIPWAVRDVSFPPMHDMSSQVITLEVDLDNEILAA